MDSGPIKKRQYRKRDSVKRRDPATGKIGETDKTIEIPGGKIGEIDKRREK